jgi:hypothetical protein
MFTNSVSRMLLCSALLLLRTMIMTVLGIVSSSLTRRYSAPLLPTSLLLQPG